MTIASTDPHVRTHIPYLDGWRGIAIVAVLLAHFKNIDIINTGRLGVELFFVLSGRLMAEILFERKVGLSKFYVKRFARVYPAFAFFVISIFLLNEAIGLFSLTVRDCLSALTLTFNYYQLWNGRPGVLGHLWSLCIEEHIYLVLGLIAWLSRRDPMRAVLLMGILSAGFVANGVLQTYLGLSYYDVYWRSDVRGASILIGAIVYLVRAPIAKFNFAWAPYVAIICGVILALNPVPDPIKYSVGTVLLALGLVLLSCAGNVARSVLETRIFRSIGAVSFSLYLWQQPFAKLSHGFDMKILSLGFIGLVTIASYFLIEKPFRRLLSRKLERRFDLSKASA